MKFRKKTSTDNHKITFRVRYAETDQGRVAHHSVYAVWFEMGRTELLRANGIVYKDLERAGVFFVVARLNIEYHHPAEYDERLELETTCTNVTAARVEHSYRLTRCSDGRLLAEGSSTLACVDENGKIRRVPEFMYPQQQQGTTV